MRLSVSLVAGLVEGVHLTLFHSNDMHGRVEAMARLSSFARRLRAEAQAAGRIVFFWDAGDAADRRYELCSASKGAAFQPVLAAMGYTLQTLGNDLALTYGPQVIAELARRGGFPILAANLRDGDGPLVEGLQSHAILPLAGGLRLGVFGMTAPWHGMYEGFGLFMPDFLPLARRIVDGLRAEGVAPIIFLSHLGLPDDRLVAEQIPEIDLIIGAHTHDLLPAGEVVNGVLIVQAGDFARYLGRVDLEIDPASGRVLARTATVLAVPEDEPPDPTVLAALAAGEEEVAGLLAQPVGELSQALELDHLAECSLGNFAADALREHMGAEAAILCSGNLRAGLPSGRITQRQINAASISTANPFLTQVSGAQILAALERSLDPAMTTPQAHGLRGVPWGVLQISGMRVEYDPGRPLGERVLAVAVNGAPLQRDQIYRLAYTDAETSSEHCFLALDPGQPATHDMPTIVPEVLGGYLRRHSPAPAPAAGRWVARDTNS